MAAGADVHGGGPDGGTAPDVRWWTADLADPEAAAAVVRAAAPDIVFHLASHVSGDRSLAAVLPTLRGNLLEHRQPARRGAAQATPPRLVLAGSMEEPAGDGAGPAVPGSPYAAAKAAASGYARLFHALYDLPVVVLRVFMVYGPGRQDEAKLVPYVDRSFLAGEPPRLSSGTRAVDWVYVDDVVAAFLAAAGVDDRRGGPHGRRGVRGADHHRVGRRARRGPGRRRGRAPVRRRCPTGRSSASRGRTSARPASCWAGLRRPRWTRAWPAPWHGSGGRTADGAPRGAGEDDRRWLNDRS